MSPSAHKIFTCPHCQKRFQWSTKIADRVAQCPKCAKKIRIPTVPGRVAEAIDPLPQRQTVEQQAADSDTYDLDMTGVDESIAEVPPTPAEQAAAQTGRCPGCNQSIKPGAVLCVKCGYNFKKGKRLQTMIAEEGQPAENPNLPASSMPSIGTSPIAQALAERKDEFKPSRVTDLFIPLAMIMLGIAFTFYISWVFEDIISKEVGWIARAWIGIGAQIVIVVPVMLFAATITVQMLGASFGPLMTGTLKMTAIAMAPLAVADALLLLFIPGAMSLSMTAAGASYVAIYVILCAPFLFMMFDLEYIEVMLTTAGIIMLRLMVTAGAAALVMTLKP